MLFFPVIIMKKTKRMILMKQVKVKVKAKAKDKIHINMSGHWSILPLL
jgi:hypothetical protein